VAIKSRLERLSETSTRTLVPIVGLKEPSNQGDLVRGVGFSESSKLMRASGWSRYLGFVGLKSCSTNS